MKTIEIISGGQKAQFTTKSVTFDDKEFFYANMSDVTNDASECVYTFTYDGEIKRLPYEEKDAKVLNAIFSQVQNLKGSKKTPGETAKSEDAQKVPAKNAESTEKAAGEPPAADTQTAETDEKAQTAEAAEGSGSDAAAPAEKKADTEEKVSEEKKEEKTVDPKKQTRLKKSLKIFGIVIGAVLAVSLIYYFFIFGTDNDPAPTNQNTTESQQYEDIDELIEDLQ